MGAPRHDDVLTAFRLQIAGAHLFDSPLYEALLREALADFEAGGAVARLLDGWEGDAVRGFLPLRILGAVHGRVLAGEAPELARFYPTAGGTPDAEAAWPALRRVIEEQAEALRPRLENFPQTNEVRRCSGLLGGFLRTARLTQRPLRLREIGCSAGLNLLWDHYHYTLGPHRWGDDGAEVQIAAEWQGPGADWDAPVRVEDRAGCDLAPRPVSSDDDVRLLESFIWPDQPERLEQLRAAVSVARREPPRVDRARALGWLAAELAQPADGCCTVVFHSSVWLYLPDDEQKAVRALIEEHGARATPERPLAWLRHEDGHPPGTIDVRLRLWPGGDEEFLARSHPHGRRVEWLGA